MATFQFDLVSPEKLAFSGEVDQVDVPGVEGGSAQLQEHYPAGGVNSSGYFNVASGGTCLFPIRMDGVVKSSSISQGPAHGTLKRLNASTYTYTAKAGYKGPDTFAVQATGKGPTSSGTSVITMNATVQ
jgi:hypothetical protein